MPTSFPLIRWRWLPSLALLILIGPFVRAQVETAIPETVIVAERLLDDDPALSAWNRSEIERISPRTIDELLASEPSFSLYRRQSAIFGNPTSSGVSLRRTGATAASRTLVVRDGIPQNDPFGGWIPWARYNPTLLDSARIVPAAQAAAWGNQSPAGVIQLTSREPRENGTRVQLTAGSQHTTGMTATSDMLSADNRLSAQLAAYSLQSDGFYGLQSGQRGPVDRRLDLETRGADLRIAWRPTEELTLEPSFSYYDEERGNGTVLSRNSTEAYDLALRVTSESPAHTHQALFYYQHRDYAALFSSVNATRTSEAPALDQYDVPGEGIGGSVSSSFSLGDELDLMVGADLRHLTGETNELAGFVNGMFLRRRRAGGDQLYGGAFGRAAYRPTSGLTIEGSARIDFWGILNGGRIERRPATGAVLRNETYDDRKGVEPSLSMALRKSVTDTISISASAGTSYRLPTINELYRPFRVRNDITEANAGLDPERFVSVGAVVDWTPTDSLSCNLAFFHHWIHDAITNAPITDPAEAAAIAGFVPPGGSVSQRRNVEQATTFGLEGRARWQTTPQLALNVSYLLSRSEFSRSPAHPMLEGNRFPQAPVHRVVAGFESNPASRLHFFGEVDFGSSQFDDALESRRLSSWWSTRIGSRIELSDHLSLHARVENLFNEEIPTGLSNSGLRSIGTPRSLWMSVNYQF